MNSLHLSKRLQALANMIDDNITVYDVGCDHAYLDIYLTLYKHNKCIAIDAKKSVVSIAKNNISKFNLNIPVLLNDGLEELNVSKNSLVVIAGMGTRTILKILKDKDISNVLIQSNDDLPHLRKMLSIWGYKITREEVIYDNKYYYVFIKAIRGNISYTKEQVLLGPLLMLDPSNQIYIMYLNHLSKKYIKMINNVPKEFISEKEELLNNSKIIDNYLYNCTKK